MTQLFNEQGQTVEAFTPEEVEQKLNEAREMAIEETNKLRQEEVDDLSLQMESKDRELEQAKQELEVEKSKDKNLAGQGRIIRDKEKKIDELEINYKKLEEKLDQRINDVEAKSREKMVNSMINELSGNDKDMTNKIKFYFDSFKGEPADDNEIQQRIQNAYVLATGAKPTSPLSGAVLSSAGGMPVINSTGEKLSDDAKDLAHKMGLSDQELKKHKLI
jgi:hypothetical protein